jgi:hypothetical protein
MKIYSKILSAILALSLVPLALSLISPQSSYAAKPASKSISGVTADKLLKAAYAKSRDHISKSPYTIKTSQYNQDKSIKTGNYSADKNGNVANRPLDGSEAILIGNDYFTTQETGLNADDLAIAKDLGLNTTAKFSHMKVTELQPPMSIKEWNQTLRLTAIFNFVGSTFPLAATMKDYPKSKLTLKTEGKKQTITFSHSLIGSRDVWTINNGMVTSFEIYNSKNKIEYKQTFELTAAEITLPTGPFFELSVLLADPRFQALQG